MTHVARDLGYLFPGESKTAEVYCGKLAKDVVEGNQYICITSHLPDIQDEICQECAIALSHPES